jgi:prepilin-type N-terminal cleavage/methylation domain-containing protein
MKYALTGIRAASPSRPSDGAAGRAGFTLIEALVALSLLLTFAAALAPVFSHGRRILAGGNGEVRAEFLLRSLLEAPVDPQNSEAARAGERDGLRWRVAVEPFADADALEPHGSPPTSAQPYKWSLYKVTTRVDWGADRSMIAETLRLGRGE